MGEVASVQCQTQRINPKIQGEDVATALFRHESGAVSVVDCSYASKVEPDPFPQTLLKVEGDQGSLELMADYRLRVVSEQLFDADAEGLGQGDSGQELGAVGVLFARLDLGVFGQQFRPSRGLDSVRLPSAALRVRGPSLPRAGPQRLPRAGACRTRSDHGRTGRSRGRCDRG